MIELSRIQGHHRLKLDIYLSFSLSLSLPCYCTMLVTLYCLVLSDKPPNTVQELVERVVGSAGDGGDTVIEERLRTRKNLPRQLW